MPRSLPEWIGASDDAPIPPRVKIRIFDKYEVRCNKCHILIRGRVRPAYDHIIALINGGENRESNLQLLCMNCHAGKTKSDVATKAKDYRVRKRHLGIKKKRSITGWRKFNGTIVKASRER